MLFLLSRLSRASVGDLLLQFCVDRDKGLLGSSCAESSSLISSVQGIGHIIFVLLTDERTLCIRALIMAILRLTLAFHSTFTHQIGRCHGEPGAVRHIRHSLIVILRFFAIGGTRNTM